MLTFYDFGAAAVARNIAVIPIATGGTGNTAPIDYTSAAISGLTTAGALIIGSNHAIASGGSGTAGASISIGAVAGTTDVAITAASRSGVASTDDFRGGSIGDGVYLHNAQSGVNLTAAASTIVGGISLDYLSNAVDRRVMAAAFAGAGTSAHVGTIALGTGTSAIAVNTVGFQPDVVILFGHSDDFAAGVTSAFAYTFGFATSDGTQRCVVGGEADNLAAGAPSQALLTDCAGAQHNFTALGYKLTISNFNSSGFDITPSASTGSDDVAYLALKFTGQQVKIVNFTTPTSTGAQAITGAGFMPQFALVVLTNLETNDSVAGTASDLQGGLGIAFIGNESWAVSLAIDSGADPTVTSSNTQNYALMGASATDNDAIIASLTSFDSDGMTLNYSAVQGTGKKGFILFIE